MTNANVLHSEPRRSGALIWLAVCLLLAATLAALLPMAALMLILNLGGVLNLSFEQIYNLYSPQVYSTGDILDTLVYRLGMIDAQYGVATAVGLFKSVVSLVLVSFSYWFAGKVSGYRVF